MAFPDSSNFSPISSSSLLSNWRCFSAFARFPRSISSSSSSSSSRACRREKVLHKFTSLRLHFRRAIQCKVGYASRGGELKNGYSAAERKIELPEFQESTLPRQFAISFRKQNENNCQERADLRVPRWHQMKTFSKSSWRNPGRDGEADTT